MIAEPSINAWLNFWQQDLFNSATVGTDKVLILRLLIIGFVVWLSKRFVTYTSGVVKARFVCNAKENIKHDVFLNMLQLNTSNMRERASSGEYLSVFVNDITILEQKYFDGLFGLIGGLFSLLILGMSFVALNTKLAIAILSFGLITMFVPVAFANKLSSKNLSYSVKLSHFTQKLKEYFGAYSTIKNYSIEQTIAERFDVANTESENAKFEMDAVMALANNVGSMLSWFMQFMGVGLGLIYVIRGEILVGTVIAARSFASDLASPLQDIVFSLNSIKSVKKIVKKIDELSKTDYVCGENDAEDMEISTIEKPDVFFDDLVIEVEGKNIVDHFSFTFQAGKKYLIVGKNGAGKSTMFKALKKQIQRTTGQIYIGDRSLSSIDNRELSRMVSYLNENVSLFSGLVRDNITLSRDGDLVCFDNAVANAKVNVDLDREIVDGGVNVSSGEQRRIEIARSLFNSVSILIFDEVVSTLDIETAYEIEKMILEYKDKTVIFVSHNFSGKLIKEYDEILVMDNGQLLAHGTYDNLIRECEYFRRICEIKFGNIGQAGADIHPSNNRN